MYVCIYKTKTVLQNITALYMKICYLKCKYCSNMMSNITLFTVIDNSYDRCFENQSNGIRIVNGPGQLPLT